MTSFNFVVACGVCHPGGGPLETDRNGHRYDRWMQERGLEPGGENGLDGDYFKAMWSKTGVIEADCLICHMPGYRYKARKAQIKSLNFRWAATVGAGLARVEGSVKAGQQPRVKYDVSKFDNVGHVNLRMVLEVPSRNCLNCHAESDFKKRGASYLGQGVGHPARSGIRCVACHYAGSRAEDPRINGREMHEIGKGDDPGDFVSDRLDNTVRTCTDCHDKGKFGAAIMRHREIPPRHFKKLSCLVCHVPWRRVKAALIQDSTVYNEAPGIWPPPKRIWQFYGPDAKPWNYYGEVHREETEFQREFQFVPEKAWYKGKIWPLNRVHSLWVGIRRKGVPGIDMVFMKDFFSMWKAHFEHPKTMYPLLSKIRDDNGDGVIEVNRQEEISALLASVRQMLVSRGRYHQGTDQVVFVRDDEFTPDGKTWQVIKKFPWEASPYGSVFKFSHDVLPASSALGAKGCTDCHSLGSAFFFRPVLTRLWDERGKLAYEPNYKLLGYTRAAVISGAIRQQFLMPVLYWGILVSIVLLGFAWALNGFTIEACTSPGSRIMILILTVAAAGPGITVILGRFLDQSALIALSQFHKVVAMIAVVICIALLATRVKKGLLFWAGVLIMAFQAATGCVLLFSENENLRQVIFTIHDVGALLGVGLFVLAALWFVTARKRSQKEI